MRDRILEDFGRAMAILSPQPELPIDPPRDYHDPDALDDEERQDQRETDGDRLYDDWYGFYQTHRRRGETE